MVPFSKNTIICAFVVRNQMLLQYSTVVFGDNVSWLNKIHEYMCLLVVAGEICFFFLLLPSYGMVMRYMRTTPHNMYLAPPKHNLLYAHTAN